MRKLCVGGAKLLKSFKRRRVLGKNLSWLFNETIHLRQTPSESLLETLDSTESWWYFIAYLRWPIISKRIFRPLRVRRRMQNAGRTRFRCSSSCHSLKTIQCLPIPSAIVQNRDLSTWEIFRNKVPRHAKQDENRRRFSYSNRAYVIDVSVQEVSVQGPYLGDGIWGMMAVLFVFFGKGTRVTTEKIANCYGLIVAPEKFIYLLAVNDQLFQRKGNIYFSCFYCWLMAHACNYLDYKGKLGWFFYTPAADRATYWGGRNSFHLTASKWTKWRRTIFPSF